MNKTFQEYLSHRSIPFRALILLALIAVLISCAITPDMKRKRSRHQEIYQISAKRPSVASCISQQLKEDPVNKHFKIVESEDSIIIMSGEMTLRIYDLEDCVGGTMVTLYQSSPYRIEISRSAIKNCRAQLESPKPEPQAQTK